MTTKTPIVALGPPPDSSVAHQEPTSSTSEEVAKEEGTKQIEGQEGVVSVQVSEKESHEVGDGSQDQLIVNEQN